jgi:hypothetical protein|tara:strand:+ start:554 stop:1099 length:546 start_codon:yes stop_codon:yes gene_type:complete
MFKLHQLTILEKINLLESLEWQKKHFQEPIAFRDFIIDCKLYLNPQSYGTKIQNRWKTINKYKSLNSSVNRGDYKDNTTYVEFKVSYLSDNKWSLLQLRPYQKIDRYDIMLIDHKFNYTLYAIPNTKMKLMIDKYGDAAHGTKDSNLNNKNIEYRMTIRNHMLYEIESFISKTTVKTNKFF